MHRWCAAGARNMRALLPVRRPRTVWLAALGVGACLVENTNAFTSHQHMPVQLRPPHPNNLIVSRPPVHETQWRRVHHEWGKPLRALPVDTDTIRLLSGAAGSGEGINLDLIKANVGTTALTLVGAFLALNIIGSILVGIFLSFVYEDITDNYVQKLQDDYPEIYEKAKRALADTDLINELVPNPEERREVAENYQNVLIFAASMRDDFDAKGDVLQFAVDKKMNEMFGQEDEKGLDQ